MQEIVCKSCGGSVTRQGNYYVCDFCASKWMIDSGNDVHAVERANAWAALREGNFEKAAELFEGIIVKDKNNHEAYWGRALALNAIIYVDDANEGKKVPTCNNITENSFLENKDFKKALSLAPSDIVSAYQKQAEQIEKIRIEWLEQASKEAPYDIFISYKESDENRKRTQDSIDVQDLYTSLVEKGYRVFFSRQSLKGKIAEQYEPYIYGAIKTAKVMIVFGEKAEYFNAVWVKNEWLRFKKLLTNGEKHKNALIAVYKNMDAYDIPMALTGGKQAIDYGVPSNYEKLLKHIDGIVNPPNRKYKVEKINVEELVPAKKQEIKQFDDLHEHNFKKVQVVPPTCNFQGYTLFRCDCGEEKKTDFTPKRTSHEWQLAERKEPTCINNGHELYECKYCDATDKKILTATGHDEFVAEEQEATCFEEGYRKYECKVCGHTRFEPISKTSHEYGDWVITKHPTCVENGEETRQCKNCPDQQRRELPAKGHSFSKWVVKTEPTCNKEGIEHRQCKTCGKIEERSLPKRQHKFSAWQNSKDGKYKERICEHCGFVEKLLTEEYIRQRNKKKARVLEIIAYGLFVIAFAVMFTDFNIAYALCSILGLTTLSLSLKLEYKKYLALFSVAFIALNVIFALINLQQVGDIAIITAIVSTIFLIALAVESREKDDEFLLITLITAAIFSGVNFLETTIFIGSGLDAELSSQIIVGTGLCALAIYGYIFYYRAELNEPINAIFYSVILLVLALLPPSIIVFCLAAASIVGGILLSIYTYNDAGWEYGIVVTETAVMCIVFLAKLGLTIVNL